MPEMKSYRFYFDWGVMIYRVNNMETVICKALNTKTPWIKVLDPDGGKIHFINLSHVHLIEEIGEDNDR